MTNNDIILTAATAAGILTAEQAEFLTSRGLMVPIHTYQFWKNAGYQVRKGEKAALKLNLWKPTKLSKAEQEDLSEEDSENITKMRLSKSSLFTWKQVDKIDGAGTSDTLLLAAEKTSPEKEETETPESPEAEEQETHTYVDRYGRLKFDYQSDGHKGSLDLYLVDWFPNTQKKLKVILGMINEADEPEKIKKEITDWIISCIKYHEPRERSKTIVKKLRSNLNFLAA